MWNQHAHSRFLPLGIYGENPRKYLLLSIFCLPCKVKVKVAQSCPTLCNPMDYIGHWILQARILEWVAVPFSRGSSQSRNRTQVSRIAGGFFTSWVTREARKWKSLSHVQLFTTPWTMACQAPLSMEFSRPEYWSGQPFLFPRDVPNPGIEPRSPAESAGRFSTIWATREAPTLQETMKYAQRLRHELQNTPV